jgi:hypothetical protein
MFVGEVIQKVDGLETHLSFHILTVAPFRLHQKRPSFSTSHELCILLQVKDGRAPTLASKMDPPG